VHAERPERLSVKVRVVAFATAREALGASELDIEVPGDAPVLADLEALLIDSHPELAALWPRLATAVDGELAGGDAPLREGVEVALLPPVSGGAPGRAALTDEAIDPQAVSDRVADPAHGATVLFLGTVRSLHEGERVEAITYDAYRRMAAETLELLVEELEAEHPGLHLAVTHRLGHLTVGEVSVAIAASSPHRDAAYGACRELLERLKRRVPIWKQEHYADGSARWREEEQLNV
jgi:molybdopterin synthase catalytic subunit